MAFDNRFLGYFRPLLNALRSADPRPMRPSEAVAWIRAHLPVSEDDLTRTVTNGRQSIFENDVHWARFYLVAAGLISKAKRGQWALTDAGRQAQPSDEQLWELYVRIRDANRPSSNVEFIEELPAPNIEEALTLEDKKFWLVGANWHREGDMTDKFVNDGVWVNGYRDKYLNIVRKINPGDLISIKSSFVQKYRLPFDIGGRQVSAMRIKARGTAIEHSEDGRHIRVSWDKSFEHRDWYFYTFRTTIVGLTPEDERARQLYEFIFYDSLQNYDWWLSRPYFVEKYGQNTAPAIEASTILPAPELLADVVEEVAEDDTEELPAYDLTDIIDDGCFLPESALSSMLARWRSKKNLILQGPPGTGKTWLAKRLGFALIGSDDRETMRTRLRIVQFHPSLSYEDFVRGYRPNGDGRLALQDGVMMEAIEAAASEPDRPFVLVIEEINRGNPAHILGEMLTLLENTKRKPSEAMELTYRKVAGERVHVPENLYVIGTMNIADRSLALVDLALRRRFAFVDLEPAFGPSWRDWCGERGIGADLLATIEARVLALNATIAASPSLGPQFRVGHSFLTPDEMVADPVAWYRAMVETEIGPLLDEHWYDAPDTARAERDKLLSGIPE
ncbi:AAA family ATPase [Azospirillum sp. 412522]|nr:AAA family ATPase [Azospirillum sp. 412522]MBY6260839.1 AAA family ATPase [Azospirillum sp. 412522]